MLTARRGDRIGEVIIQMRHLSPEKKGRVYLTWQNLPYMTHVQRTIIFFAFRARFIVNGHCDGIANDKAKDVCINMTTSPNKRNYASTLYV